MYKTNKIQEENYDIIIIGAGPAGLTAGIYVHRSNLSSIVFSGKSPPRLALAHRIENYPGLVKPVTGKELLDEIQKQAESQGVIIRYEDILSFYLDSKEKIITSKERLYKSKAVIIAIGLGPRRKSITGEKEFVGRGVSYCAKCDGPLYKDKDVIIIGNDNETGEEALELIGMGVNTSICTDGKDLEMSNDLLDKLNEKGVNFYNNSSIKEIFGTQTVEGIQLEDKNKIESNGVFIIDTVPASLLLQTSALKLAENGCIEVNVGMETNIKGVFAAGDIICGYKQVSTAVGTGAIAALSAIKYIRSLK